MYIRRKKKTEEEKANREAEIRKIWDFFKEIWDERPHRSEISGIWLGNEPLTTFFDHLLPKELYPELKFEKENIILVTPDEHADKTGGWPHPKHQEAILEAKKRFL